MTKEDIVPAIEFDTHRFWINSTNLINDDSLFVQRGIDDVNNIYNNSSKYQNLFAITDALFRTCYLDKGEYIIAFMNAMILTNRRLFIWFNDLKKTIPLKNLTKYEAAKWDGGISGEYLENGALQKFRLKNTWLLPDAVNNAINRHKKDELSDSNLIISSMFKQTIQSKFDIKEQIYSSWTSLEMSNAESINTVVPVYKAPKNYRGIITLVAFILFMGGCVYLIEKNSDTPTASVYTNSGDPSHDQYGKKRKKCPWCGGVGKVGYLGESKVQIEKTGMGLGNSCTTCNGTGYVDDNQ